MDFEKLKTFYSVVKLGTVKAASDQLGLTVSGISRQISALEDELKHKLFERINQRLVLTRKGDLFFDSTKKILTELDSAIDLLHEDEESIKGPLKLATTQAIAALWIVDDITEFLHNHPETQLTIIAQDKEQDLSMREADVAIRGYIKGNNDLVQLPLIVNYMNLYATKEYLEKHGTPTNPEDLEHHHIIGYGDGIPHPHEKINWHLQYLPHNKKTFLNINSGAAILHAVENSIGIGSLSQVGAYFSTKPLVRVLPKLSGPKVEMMYIFPKSLTHSQKVIKLYEYILKKYKQIQFDQ